MEDFKTWKIMKVREDIPEEEWEDLHIISKGMYDIIKGDNVFASEPDIDNDCIVYSTRDGFNLGGLIGWWLGADALEELR